MNEIQCFSVFLFFHNLALLYGKTRKQNWKTYVNHFKYTNNYCELSLDLFLSKMKCFPVFSFVFPFFHHFKTGKHSVFKKSSEFHWKVSKLTLESFLNENHCFPVFHDLTLLRLKTRKKTWKRTIYYFKLALDLFSSKIKCFPVFQFCFPVFLFFRDFKIGKQEKFNFLIIIRT